ncbi:GNAT family N-acetyltransferase [Chryseobacterium sp. ERMR1:04]|uniref:GNAT family N-acetyltransferase n=1 Tax=Chryseobacterium sp. ERMR1:04 TaxID=1705393 RepID=UPI0006C84FA5|nr:GNAT family N-acetyltransferase [Chryseobacterium sp. ERMR1:04]KPH12775.1 acetyltransferase [Chryseobacterium sp. ERMR1:04]
MGVIIETKRLLLRELSPDDAGHFYSLNLNPNVMKYTGDVAFVSVEEARVFLENYKDYKDNGFGRWAVMNKLNNEFIGWCGLKYNKELEETDIGFRFFEKHWNKGFATESAKACVDFGFNELNKQKIIGRAMKENIASINVLQKIGLVFEKEFDFNGEQGVLYEIYQATNSYE